MPLTSNEEDEYIDLYIKLVDKQDTSLYTVRCLNELQKKNKSATKFCNKAIEMYKHYRRHRNKRCKKNISDITTELVNNVMAVNMSEVDKERILENIEQIMIQIEILN